MGDRKIKDKEELRYNCTVYIQSTIELAEPTGETDLVDTNVVLLGILRVVPSPEGGVGAVADPGQGVKLQETDT